MMLGRNIFGFIVLFLRQNFNNTQKNNATANIEYAALFLIPIVDISETIDRP
jgi:hypothetical protein